MGCSNSPLPKEIKFPNYKPITERQKPDPLREEKISQNKMNQNKENKQLLKDEGKENDMGKMMEDTNENKKPLDENKKLSQPIEKPDLLFNKNICNSIASSLPSRTDTDLESLKNLIKEKSKNLSKKEKAYIIFLWISQNIEYDLENLKLGKSIDCTPIGVFKMEKQYALVMLVYFQIYQFI